MKLMRYVIILFVLSGLPDLLTGQNIQSGYRYELLGEENIGRIDSLIRSKLSASHENGGEFVRMFAEGDPVQGILQFDGMGQDTLSGASGTIYPTSCLCLEYRDTLEITNVFPLGITVNYRIYTSEEKYQVELLFGDDSDNNKIYKQHPDDREFVGYLEKEFQSTNLKLHFPEEGGNPVIYGEFTGKIVPFYKKEENDRLKKYHFRLTSLFRCEIQDVEEVSDKK